MTEERGGATALRDCTVLEHGKRHSGLKLQLLRLLLVLCYHSLDDIIPPALCHVAAGLRKIEKVHAHQTPALPGSVCGHNALDVWLLESHSCIWSSRKRAGSCICMKMSVHPSFNRLITA